MADDMPYHEKMAKEAQLRAKILYEGRPDSSARIMVEPTKRREVEDFAAQLQHIQPPEAAPEKVEYARMDASAMLARLARGNEELLEVLRSAVLSQDMAAFVDALDKHNIGTKLDRNNLRHFIVKQDRDAIAACLRMIARGSDERLMEETSQVDVGREVANHAYPLMGNNRRLHITTFLRGNDVSNPLPFRRPPHSDEPPETCSAIGLGDVAEEWEQSLQFHAYMLDGANAAMDLMSEAAGYGQFDGRLNSNRAYG